MFLVTAPALAVLDNIKHGFFTRQGGVSAGDYATLNTGWGSKDDPANVVENRRRVAAAMEVAPDDLLTCYQIHSPTAVTVAEAWDKDGRPEADAMVTNRPGLALGILTADCVPVLFADPFAKVIGAAHAGWRGALTGVIDNTVKAMRDLGAKPANITAAIGPCIWQRSYEVGPDFPAPFVAMNADYDRFFFPSAKPRHYMFDLPGFVAAKLRKLGVADIAESPDDTFAKPELYFSYRRSTLEGKSEAGRLISAIGLK